ncbi:LamG-like jellyroll fold domain-containing protein [Actinoplanes awajinensis]|uniref:Protein kinase domain-containing protein n=1 Tax=Actinoplanes awajinensis subsp. mycoplanecinus TaxID=135947 RepID=A0A101JDR2_9ACTN|nr:LamG-like jellyroll fold domain-containing protein [Actinoplanes awajinensis]KUL24943.1 hypothetical protein ADL15_42490 [Actinoplanes awajinensis subsp. mycoplanecinus]
MDGARGPGIDTPAGYTRLRRIGAGAEADVFQAWEEHAQEWVVLRIFHGYVSGRRQEADFADRYESAARLGAHPGIVGVRSGGVTATGRAWLATDLVRGGTLADALRSGPFPPERALALAAVLADALAWAHATPVTHGRLDADHVLLAADGQPMLTGFALAAAEQSPRADVSALAVLLVHLLTGRPGTTTPELARYPGLSAVPGLIRLLADGQVPGSAAEFAYRLRDIAARLQQPALSAPSGAYPALTAPSATSARLTVPTATHRAPTQENPLLYARKRPATGRRRAGLTAVGLVVAVAGTVGAVHLASGGTATPSALPATAPATGTGGAAVTPTCPPATTEVADGSRPATLWWPFDEGTGTVGCDAAGSDTATLSAGAGWRTVAPTALRLTADTADSYASGSAPAIRTDQSFTVMARVFLTDTDATHGVLSQPGSTSSGFILKYEKRTDSWRLIMPRTDVVSPVVDGPSSTTRPVVGAWTHLAAVYDAGARQITLYVDGTAEDTVAHPQSWNATGPVQVARSWYDGAWTDRFAGAIADVRAYQEVVRAAEIDTIANLSR